MRIRVLIGLRSTRRRPVLATAPILLLAAFILLRAPAAWSDDFVVIRNAKNSTTSVTPAQAKEMAIGKRKIWPSGAVVGMVLTPVGSPELGWFAGQVCGVVDAALMAKIKQEVFKGELRKPVLVASANEVVTAVAADEGAFGIVRADAVKTLPPGVAVLAVK